MKVLEGTVAGLISGLVKAFGADKLKAFIENDWHLLEAAFNALNPGFKPDYHAAGLTPEQAARAEKLRQTTLRKVVLPALGMAKTIASRFPREVVEEKVTAKWIYEKIKQRHPEIAAIIDSYGEKGWRWLEKEAKMIVDFLVGRS